MKREWIANANMLALEKADFFSGARKIIRGRSIVIEKPSDDLYMEDLGFGKAKMTMLKRLYWHEESHATAVRLWGERVARDKYGSVGFSCYNHLVKAGEQRSFWAEHHEKAKAKKEGREYKINRTSVMGPCIQAVTITYLPDGTPSVDAFYRTTEFYKKFPADLVFIRDVLLPPFEFETIPAIRFHFANITMHPMYYITAIPNMPDVIKDLERIRKKDKHFFNWCVKWTARYLCKEYNRGIDKFAQAQRTQAAGLRLIQPATLKQLRAYLREHHPGIRGGPDQVEEGDDE